MAELKLTPAQRAVVEHRGSALLVSAAAGSGKTKVLVERLLGMVCNPIHPKNVDDFLMITYTKAAAAELRGKIAAALSERLAAQPDNRHLQRQMNRLYLAQISTVHAFCATLLRTYAHQLELPADFRVAEEMECDVLRQRCLERAMEQSYTQLSASPQIRCFIDTMGFGRDDRAAGAIILRMYQSVLCHPEPEQWMEQCIAAAQVQGDPLQTVWGQALWNETRRQLQRSARKLQQAAQAGQADEKLNKSYVPLFLQNAELVEQIAAQSRWDEIGAFSGAEFGRLTAVRGCENQALQEWMKTVRKQCTDSTKKLLLPFAASAAQVMEDQQHTAQAIEGMFAVLRSFMKLYQAEKRRRHILDFADLEQGAVRLLLCRGTLQPTPEAKETAQRYCEIMVDEYQDTNEVQDRIFHAISQAGKNLFMVGDVKQSIYRFRLADPSIFLEKYQTFADKGEAEDGAPCRILLSQNFRSDPEILDAANCVFRAVMRRNVGGLDYGDAEALQTEKQRRDGGAPAVELHTIDTDGLSSDDVQTPEKPEIEAAFVASRIARLLKDGTKIPDGDGQRPLQPQDITVLLRSVKSDAQYYVTALRRVGINAACDTGGSILDTVELEALTATLQILDNPHQDIPLAAAMTSPIFGISNDSLASVRVGRKTGDLFDAVCDAARTEPVLREFLQALRRLQQQAGLLRLYEVMQLLENELSLRKIFGAMPQGRRRLQNLNAFFALAAEFGEEKTLGQFVSYLDGLKAQGVSGGAAAQGADAVRIMSIHKSKGLEFPVVFLAGLSKQFNLQDLAAPVLTDAKLGVGCSLVDTEKRVSYPTAAKKAIALRQQQESISEELRVLYVAMTRPKHRLIMYYCSAHLQADLKRLALELMGGSAAEAAESARSIGDWVLLCALTRTEAGELFRLAECSPPAAVSEIPWKIACHRAEEFAASGQIAGTVQELPALLLPNADTLRRQLGYVYPYPAATTLPTKITATQLKGRLLDEESAEQAKPVLPMRRFRFEKPRFASEQRGLSPSERGTATHLAMQFLQYDACRTREGIDAELKRLVTQRYLTQQQCDAVNADGIWRFFASELGQRVLQTKQVVREFKFSVLTDGALIAPEATGEQVLLQGVTDCCLVEDAGLTVIDFKTDRVQQGNEEQAAAYYKGQMEAYSLALARIFKKPVRQRILYFFATGTAVSV